MNRKLQCGIWNKNPVKENTGCINKNVIVLFCQVNLLNSISIAVQDQLK